MHSGQHRFLQLSGLFCLLVLCAVMATESRAAASTSTRDLVWSASDGLRREIFYSSFDSGAWTEPYKVTDDNADKITPSIDRTPAGIRYIVWAAIGHDGLTIKYATEEGGTWSEPLDFPDLPATASTPFVGVDRAGVVWVVFSGNDGDDDDIFCIRRSGASWTKPTKVHAENDTPDLNPFLEIDDTGNLQVAWEGYRGEKYTMLQATWNGTKWLAEKMTAEDLEAATTEREQAQSAMPAFVEDGRQAFLRTYGK